MDAIANNVVYIIATIVIVLVAIAGYYYNKWSLRIAAPNEWLLVIRDGKQLKAGVGMRHYAGLNDSVVRIPACIYKVNLICTSSSVYFFARFSTHHPFSFDCPDHLQSSASHEGNAGSRGILLNSISFRMQCIDLAFEWFAIFFLQNVVINIC